MACEGGMPLLQSPPGSTWGRGCSQTSVQVAQSSLTKSHSRCSVERITPLPYFGIDRMGDFGRAGAASLWKSTPLFSTGNSETELATMGLRLNLRSPLRDARNA